MITELFTCGQINVLVGTKSLLGEGWDSPCINSLILATYVGSFMLSSALNTALTGGGSSGDIVIPVYIGGDMIDEIVVTAQQRMNLKSGGR